MRRLLALLAFAAPAAAAADTSLAQLFEAIAKHPPQEAAFTEKKFIALLDKPVESSGVLIYTPPDRMEKRTLEPRRESLVIDRTTVVIERAGKRRALPLADYPEMESIFAGLRDTLRGDLGALTQRYSAGLQGDAAQWRLTLRPLAGTGSEKVERIELAGSQWHVSRVEVILGSGERSVMEITPLAASTHQPRDPR
jgi:outer membrane lipoprotein-sorting protein